MTQSAPSRTAFATSLTSARVGLGLYWKYLQDRRRDSNSLHSRSWTGRGSVSVPERPVEQENATYLKHLSGDDNGLANDIALGNHHFLSEEDLTSRNFNTKVATSDHDTVGHCQNLVKVLNTLLVLNLDDDLDVGTVGTENLSDVTDVLSATDEGSEDHVNTVLDTELKILLVLLRESGKVDIGLREVDALTGAEGSVVESPDLDIRSID